MNIKEQKIVAYLKKHLSRPRFLHSLGTMRMAELIARCHGADPAKARVAGLLHDCSKGMSIAALRAHARRYDPRIMRDNIVQQNPVLLHGYASADIAKKYFGIRAPDILQAIARHTIAGPRMSMLDHIIYLADMIAPDRRYRESSALRRLARRDLIAAMKKGLAIKIRLVLRQKGMIHPFAVFAWNELSLCQENRGLESADKKRMGFRKGEPRALARAGSI
jgi:predicted HD superfamily hydrolase involved in NAD metabolism